MTLGRRLGAVIGLVLFACGQAAAQSAPPSAATPPLSIDQARLDPQRGVLAIRGKGLGPEVVVTMSGETLPLMPGATREQVEALAPARVLVTPGTYRISVVDPASRAETGFVVVSAVTDEAREQAVGSKANSDSVVASPTPVGRARTQTTPQASRQADAQSSGPSPQLIEDLASRNTAVGPLALHSIAGGHSNVAVGFEAMKLNSTGVFNSASGAYALGLNTTGAENAAYGYAALYENATGVRNTASGAYALRSNTIGMRNAALGFESLFSNASGNDNVAVGHAALRANTSGNDNVAAGTSALTSNTLGYANTALGTNALRANADGWGNTATGWNALSASASGPGNTATGLAALANSVGSHNTAVGHLAGMDASTGSHNVYLGAYARGLATDANTMRLGLPYDGATGLGQNRTFIAGIFGTQLTSPAQQVFIDVNGQLGILGAPIVSQPISGTLNAVPRDQAHDERLEALDEIVRQQQATMAQQSATIAALSAKAEEHAAALAALRAQVSARAGATRKR